MKIKNLLVFALLIINAFQFSEAQNNIPVTVTHTSSSRSITTLDYSLNSVLWQQRSGEYKALCYQAFSLAKLRLNEKIALHKKDEASLAIITDIDETVLDNSPQQAHDLLRHTTY